MRAYFLDGSLKGQVKEIQEGDVYHVAVTKPLSVTESMLSEEYVPIYYNYSFQTEEYRPRFSDGHITFYSINENFSSYLINMFTVIEEQKKEIEKLRPYTYTYASLDIPNRVWLSGPVDIFNDFADVKAYGKFGLKDAKTA